MEFLEYIISPEHFPHVLEAFERGISIVFMCCALIVAAVFMDMWVGIDAAKAAHEPLMSHGLRRTITKALDYFRVLLFASLIDILGAFLLLSNSEESVINVETGIKHEQKKQGKMTIVMNKML